MRSFRRFIPALLFVLAAPAVQAQHAQGAQGVQGQRGPTLQRAAVGVRASKPTPAKTPPRFAETNRNRALMIVGGAALITGAIINETSGQIIMVGGAIVGLYGLYKYLE